MEGRTKTGIQGLDVALNGGFPQGNLVLLSGGAGTGKSTLTLQFLLNGAKDFGEKGLYVSTEQDIQEIKKQGRGFGWDIESLIKKNLFRIKYLDITKGTDFLSELDRIVDEFKPDRLVIDSMTTLTDALLVSGITEKESFSMVQIAESVSPIPRTEKVIAKGLLYQLIVELRRYGLTTLLTSELYEDSKSLSADGVTEFIADGVLEMHYLGIGGGSDSRTFRVRKMRYTDHNKLYLNYQLKSGEGFVVAEDEGMGVLMK